MRLAEPPTTQWGCTPLAVSSELYSRLPMNTGSPFNGCSTRSYSIDRHERTQSVLPPTSQLANHDGNVLMVCVFLPPFVSLTCTRKSCPFFGSSTIKVMNNLLLSAHVASAIVKSSRS